MYSKTCSFFIALVLLSGFAYCQKIHVFGGVTINKQKDIFHSSQFGDRDFANGSRSYFQIGLEALFPLKGSDFLIIPGLKLVQKGTSRQQVIFTGTGPDDFEQADLYRKMPYLEFTPAISYRIFKGNAFKIDLSIFPYAAIAVGGKEEIPFVEQSTNPYVNQNYSSPRDISYTENEFKKADFGAGLSIQGIIADKLNIGFGYEHGFADIHNSSLRTVINKSFGITIGYLFSL